MKLIFSIIFAFLLTLSVCSEAAPVDDGFVTVQEMEEALNSEDKTLIASTLEQVRKQKYGGEIFPYLNEVWLAYKKQGEFPNFFEDDEMKLRFSLVLLEADSLGYIKTDKVGIFDFLEDLINRKPGSFSGLPILMLTNFKRENQGIKMPGFSVPKGELENNLGESEFFPPLVRKQPTRDDLLEIFSRDNIDAIFYVLETLKRNWPDATYFPFLNDLWDGNTEKYPDLDWNTINKDIVKIGLANVLLFPHPEGKKHVKKEEMRALALNNLKKSDKFVFKEALRTLGYVDNLEDIPLLISIALEENPHTFYDAVGGIMLMSNPGAFEALDYLIANVKEPRFVEFVQKTKAVPRPE